MTQFGTVEPSTQGDQFKPQDNVGHLLVIQPTGLRDGIPARNKQPGKPDTITGLRCNVLDLDGNPAPRADDETGKDGRIFIEAMLFGGQWVDDMKGKLGQLIVVTVRKRQSTTSSYSFAFPEPAEAEQIKRAQEYWAANGDPFVKFDTTDPLS